MLPVHTVCQSASPHENDFASSITFGEMRRFGCLATFSRMQVGRAEHTITERKPLNPLSSRFPFSGHHQKWPRAQIILKVTGFLSPAAVNWPCITAFTQE